MDAPLDVVDLVLEALVPPDGEWERVGYDVARPKGSLSSCSLVCRSWYSLSRRHLFHDVIYSFASKEETTWGTTDFGGHGRWRTFLSDDRPDDLRVKQPCKSLPLFIQFLLNQSTLASHIRQLSLHYFPYSWFHSGNIPEQPQFRFDDEERHIPQSLFYALLRALPNLQSLCLRDIFLKSKTFGLESEALARPLVSLDLLSISYPLATSCHQEHLILRLINSCASVRRLQLVVPDAEPVNMVNGHISQIDQLVLSNIPCQTGICRYLLGLNVTSLTIDAAYGEDFLLYNEYFRQMGHTLKELRIRLAFFTTDPADFDIFPCVNLERLSISVPFWVQEYYIDDSAICLLAPLAQAMVTMPKLHDFRIHFHFNGTFAEYITPTHEQTASFAQSISATDEALVALAHKLHLPTLYFAPHAIAGMEGWVKAFLKKIFSGLDERGLLTFVDEDDDWMIDSSSHIPLPEIAY